VSRTDGRTDGQTDGQNYYINIARQQQYADAVTRDKNCNLHCVPKMCIAFMTLNFCSKSVKVKMEEGKFCNYTITHDGKSNCIGDIAGSLCITVKALNAIILRYVNKR